MIIPTAKATRCKSNETGGAAGEKRKTSWGLREKSHSTRGPRAGQRMRSEDRVEIGQRLATKNAFFIERKGQTSNYGEQLESRSRSE